MNTWPGPKPLKPENLDFRGRDGYIYVYVRVYKYMYMYVNVYMYPETRHPEPQKLHNRGPESR